MNKIFDNLFKALKAEGLIFCNWKGHDNVDQILDGRGDLDIFVPIESKEKFEQIAINSGFRRVVSYQADHPHIEHYYGLDVATLKFVHLHVYFKFVTGEHISKNYILPLENYITKNIESASLLPSIKENAKSNIFLIRYFLKIGSLFGLFQYLRESKKYSDEWNAMNQIIDDEVLDLNLTKEMLFQMKDTYQNSSFIKKLMLSFRVKSKLRKFRRKSLMNHLLYNIQSINLRLLNKIFIKKKKLLDPGFVVAICGLDGSGKSSLVSELRESFSKDFSVKVLHLGRPSSSPLTFFLNPLISIYSILKRLNVKSNKPSSSPKTNRISNIHAFRSLFLAYDRKKESLKALRYSQSGYIVICDRYPGIIEGKMDSPRITSDKDRGWFYQFCHNKEKDLYKSINPAKAIFHLTVPLEVSIERNDNRVKFGKETNEELRQRFAQNEDATFLAEQYNFIDATLPFEEVLSAVSLSIWNIGT